jgi:hypothetical protein
MSRLCDRLFNLHLYVPCRIMSASAACLVLTLPSLCGAASPFAPISTYPSGGAAQYIAVADVNRDGKPDVFVSNLNGVISLVIGHGDGSFRSPATIAQFAAGSYPIATADFNRDGKPDLAVLAPGAGKVLIYLGRGDGTFEAPKSVTVTNSPKYMVVGDVNGDHNPDLLFNAISGTASGFTILLGKGNGSFKSPRMITAINGAAGSLLTVGDLNNDGHLDVVTCDSNGDAESFLGNGDAGPSASSPASRTAPPPPAKASSCLRTSTGPARSTWWSATSAIRDSKAASPSWKATETAPSPPPILSTSPLASFPPISAQPT